MTPRQRSALLWSAILPLAGCGGKSYLPSDMMSTYTVRTNFYKDVEPLEFRQVVSVGGARGFVLSGPLGESWVAWKQGMLVTSRLANATFQPVLPILAPGQLGDTVRWSGVVSTPTGSEQATAALTQERAAVSIAGRRFKTIHSKLVLDTSRRQVELESDFAPGVGLVRQEQRTNGKFDIEIELLSGK